MKLTDAEMVAAIEGIIAANARALNEQPVLGLRLRPDGSVRIQERRRDGTWIRGQYRHYRTLTRCFEASMRAAKRAAFVAQLVADGVPVDRAVREAEYIDVGL